jgi:multisubunit Na+/H+ antiporter MnhC subunit
LNRSGYLQGADPVLTPTENFFVDEIVRRIRAVGLGLGGVDFYDPLRFIEIQQIAFTVGTDDALILQRATNKRVYLFVINTHATQRLFLTHGTVATATLGVPLEANLGWWEWIYPVPQADVHVIANGASTTGVVTYGEMDPAAFGLG